MGESPAGVGIRRGRGGGCLNPFYGNNRPFSSYGGRRDRPRAGSPAPSGLKMTGLAWPRFLSREQPERIMAAGVIALRGVAVHNLKEVDLDIPRGKLIVLCGLSGSGKTSLALDTLYAEGQRRYIESFSPYTRQFLERLEKPAADRIDGMPPAIAVTHKNTSRSNRSTVGTATETSDYLRLLLGPDRPVVLPRLRRPGPPRNAANRGRRTGPAAGRRPDCWSPSSAAGQRRRSGRAWSNRCAGRASFAWSIEGRIGESDRSGRGGHAAGDHRAAGAGRRRSAHGRRQRGPLARFAGDRLRQGGIGLPGVGGRVGRRRATCRPARRFRSMASPGGSWSSAGGCAAKRAAAIIPRSSRGC